MHCPSFILSCALLLVSIPATKAVPLPSGTSLDILDSSRGALSSHSSSFSQYTDKCSTDPSVLPFMVDDSHRAAFFSSKATRLATPKAKPSGSNKSSSTKKHKKQKREEPSIFQVDLPLDMLEDSVIPRPTAAQLAASRAAHQPITIELSDAQERALAGGDMLLGLPEDEHVVFVNKNVRLAQRSALLNDIDNALASMMV